MTRPGLLLVMVVASGVLLVAQSDEPQFEVTSIKPSGTASVGGFSGSGVGVRPGGVFSATNSSVLQLVRFAYNLLEDQVIGGPDWIRSERFTVTAKAPAEVPREQVRQMLQALMAERFRLRVRNDTREMPIFELRLARTDGRVGPNLHNCADLNDKAGLSTPDKPFTAPPGGAVAAGDCADLGSLVNLASSFVGGVVVNRTDLPGEWRYNIQFGPDLPADAANSQLPSFITALREQLGLKLERTQGTVPVVVIESVERPTPN